MQIFVQQGSFTKFALLLFCSASANVSLSTVSILFSLKCNILYLQIPLQQLTTFAALDGKDAPLMSCTKILISILLGPNGYSAK